jgi:hypothetical protein
MGGVGDEKRFFHWDPELCDGGLPQPMFDKRSRCVAIGPHTAFNLANWCCP